MRNARVIREERVTPMQAEEMLHKALFTRAKVDWSKTRLPELQTPKGLKLIEVIKGTWEELLSLDHGEPRWTIYDPG